MIRIFSRLGFGSFFLIMACATPPSAPPTAPPTHNAQYFERGIASWYGARFQGRPTASGEPFDMHKFTAAHKTLPFGSIVLVKSTSNQRTVRVRINDRGPFIKGRVIDLSKAAAQQLGIVQKGHDEVVLYLEKRDLASQIELRN